MKHTEHIIEEHSGIHYQQAVSAGYLFKIVLISSKPQSNRAL